MQNEDKKRRKHGGLTRTSWGNFGRHEWAILGSSCEKIQVFGAAVAGALAPRHGAWVDAHHTHMDFSETANHQDFAWRMTDFQGFFRTDSPLDSFLGQKMALQAADFVLVNGNHFPAQRQILLLSPEKESSVRKRLDQLTQIDAVVSPDGKLGVFEFLKEKIDPNVPIFSSEEAADRIAEILKNHLDAAKPPLFGLVLAGGKSERMGFDKTNIAWHQGQPQEQYLARILATFCKKTYISKRETPTTHLPSEIPILTDSFLGLGPFGGILSAFRQHPNAAWLVVACDLPLLDVATLDFLVKNRHPEAIATAFKSPTAEKDGHRFPEPLVAIWEPKSYPLLLQSLALGISCPRKVLINSPTHQIEAPNPEALTNVNYPEEYAAVRGRLGDGK